MAQEKTPEVDLFSFLLEKYREWQRTGFVKVTNGEFPDTQFIQPSEAVSRAEEPEKIVLFFREMVSKLTIRKVYLDLPERLVLDTKMGIFSIGNKDRADTNKTVYFGIFDTDAPVAAQAATVKEDGQPAVVFFDVFKNKVG